MKAIAISDGDEVKRLRHENAALRDRIDEVEEIVGLKLVPPMAGWLTGDQRAMLGILLSRDAITTESLFTLVHGSRPECDQPDIKIINVQMCHLRARLHRRCAALRAAQITIHNRWGGTFWIAAADKPRLRAMLRETD